MPIDLWPECRSWPRCSARDLDYDAAPIINAQQSGCVVLSATIFQLELAAGETTLSNATTAANSTRVILVDVETYI
jgi:hypothetical protein